MSEATAEPGPVDVPSVPEPQFDGMLPGAGEPVAGYPVPGDLLRG
jgi:hypothetical protein